MVDDHTKQFGHPQRLGDRGVNKEVRTEFHAVVEADEKGVRHTADGTAVEKTTQPEPKDEREEMPLPTDPSGIFLGGLFFLAILTVLYVAAEIILPVVLAVVLKLFLQPLVRLLERVHVPRGIGAALSVLLVLGVFAGTISALAGPAASWAGKLPQAIPQLRDQLAFLHGPIDAAQSMMHQVQGLLGNGDGLGMPLAPPSRSGNLIGALFSGTATVTASLFTTLLVLFYLLVSAETFMLRLVEILPHFRNKRQAVEISLHVERDVSVYLLTVTLINAVVGVATGLVMWACGVANPPLWGVMAFVLNYVPILGAMCGIVIFAMASILSLGVSWWAVLPVGLYFCIHIIEGEFVTPMLIARRFTINPVAVILALVFWYWMWGVPGAILAVPMLAITKIICDDVRPLRALGHLLEG
jgi:predicted PurR-regulated permease PerM